MSRSAPTKGTYLVDEASARVSPPAEVWTGRVRISVLADDRCLLITRTGYEWPVRLEDTRAATDDEIAAYERDFSYVL